MTRDAAGSPVRVLVVDDHPVFRMGMAALLASLDGIEVVGEAASAGRGRGRRGDHEPDVVVMDLHLGETTGVEATREIVRRHPEVGVLVVTMMDDDDSVFASMRAGARGYLLKGAAPAEVERAHAGGGQRRGAARGRRGQPGRRLPRRGAGPAAPRPSRSPT